MVPFAPVPPYRREGHLQGSGGLCDRQRDRNEPRVAAGVGRFLGRSRRSF